jgi:hypothetical protein
MLISALQAVMAMPTATQTTTANGPMAFCRGLLLIHSNPVLAVARTFSNELSTSTSTGIPVTVATRSKKPAEERTISPLPSRKSRPLVAPQKSAIEENKKNL